MLGAALCYLSLSLRSGRGKVVCSCGVSCMAWGGNVIVYISNYSFCFNWKGRELSHLLLLRWMGEKSL